MSLDPPLGRRVATRLGQIWFDADLSEADLDTLVDRARFPDRAKLRERYAAWRWAGDPAQMSSVFALRLDGRLVGFTNLLRKTAEENYSHWHIIDPKDRAGGISSLIYPTRIDLYFYLFPIERLIHQTRITNTGVNRMLDKYVPVAKTEFVERPDGLAKPGEFHMRYVTRADLPRIRETGALLAR